MNFSEYFWKNKCIFLFSHLLQLLFWLYYFILPLALTWRFYHEFQSSMFQPFRFFYQPFYWPLLLFMLLVTLPSNFTMTLAALVENNLWLVPAWQPDFVHAPCHFANLHCIFLHFCITELFQHLARIGWSLTGFYGNLFIQSCFAC